VSELLALAEAMSAAQKKATGNGKLDMAGIMAAMAVATDRSRSESRGAGGISRGGEGLEEKNGIGEGGNSRDVGFSRGDQGNTKSEKKTSLRKEEVSEADVNNRINEKVIMNPRSSRISGEPTANKNTFGNLMRESSSLSLFSTPKPYKKLEESNETAKYFSVQNTDDNKLHRISATAAGNNDKDEIAKDINDYIDQNDEGIEKLMEKIDKMSATKKKVTGNEKLNLSDLIIAMASIIQDDGVDAKALPRNINSVENKKPGRNLSSPTAGRTFEATSLVRKEAVKGANKAEGGMEDKNVDKGGMEDKNVDKVGMKDKTVDKEKLMNNSEEQLSDTAVRKLVYSQYRQMLKNHKN